MDASSGEALSENDRAVLRALIEANGSVVGRKELARRAGLTEASDRRCDRAIVEIRRALGASAVVTVRKRGWRIVKEVG